MQSALDFIYKILVLFKLDHKTWLVKTLMTSGILMISQPIWSQLLSNTIESEYSLVLADSSPYGIALIALSLLIFLLNRHDLIKFDTWNTHKTSQIINIGPNRFSAIFPRPMRCTPTLRFTNISKESVSTLKIENWNSLGFTVHLPPTISINNIEFEADAKPGPPKLWYKVRKFLQRTPN